MNLPTSLSASVLCHWLSTKSICRLDSALCERSHRFAYLSLLQSAECVNKFSARSNKELTWMNKRSIRSKSFYILDDSYSEDECQKFLRNSGQCLLSFYATRLVSTVSRFLVQNCRNLVRFHAMGCDKTGEYIELLRTNLNLVELSLHTSAPFSMSSVALPKLKYLKLDLSVLKDEMLVALVKAASHLCFLSVSFTPVTSAGLVAAAQYGPKLRFLKLPDLGDIDNGLLLMAPLWVHIAHLDLSHCQNLTDAGVVAVAVHMKALRSIQIINTTGVTNACLLSLAKHQHQTLEAFIATDPFLSRFRTEDDPQKFSASAVTAFREQCTNLLVFDWRRSLDWYFATDKAVIINYVTHSDRITTLLVSYLDDEILRAIAFHCSQLKELDLMRTKKNNLALCSDAAWLELVHQCSNLSYLIIWDEEQRTRLQRLLVAYPRLTIQGYVFTPTSSDMKYNIDNLYQTGQ